MSARNSSLPKEVTMRPGPGTYDGKYDHKYKDIKYSFSQLERPDQVSRDHRLFPGPAEYSDKLDRDFGHEAPKVSFYSF
jgi:Sperm-tail PG-rich repeat